MSGGIASGDSHSPSLKQIIEIRGKREHQWRHTNRSGPLKSGPLAIISSVRFSAANRDSACDAVVVSGSRLDSDPPGRITLVASLRCILWPISSCDSAEFISLLSLPYPVPALRRIGNSNSFQVANRQLFPDLVREGLPTIRDLGVLNSVSAAAFGLTSQCPLYIIECILSNREA